MSNGPGHFLVQKGDDKPARFEHEGAWSKILDNAGLVGGNLPEVEIEGATGDNDLTITAGKDLWELQFSSANNSIYFGPAPEEWKDKLRNNAWLGDEFGSAVMILSVPSPTIPGDITKSIPLRKGANGDPTSVWKAFEISDKNNQLNNFIEQFERGSLLKVQLHTSTSPSPNSNGVWCTTTPESYAVTVRLNFIFTAEGAISGIENSPVGRAISWVNEKLGVNISLDKIKSTFSSLPPVYITCSRKTTYPVTDEPTASEPEWTFSIQFAIFNFDFAIDFSSEDTTFYLRPTASLTDIFGDISEALGNPSGVDNADMPSTDDEIFSRLIGNRLLLWYIHLDQKISEPEREPVLEPTPEPAHETDLESSTKARPDEHTGNSVEQPPNHAATTGSGGQDGVEPSHASTTEHSLDHVNRTASGVEPSNQPINEPAGVHPSTEVARAPSSLSWGIGILAVWNVGPQVPLVMALTYESDKKLFRGKLVLGNDPLLVDQRDKDFDSRVALPGELLKTVDIDIAHIDDTISLWDVFTDSGTPPEAVRRIPFNLAGAEVTFQSEGLSQANPLKASGKSKTVTFLMSIVGDSTKPATPADEIPSGFVWSQVTVLASQTVEKTGIGAAAVSRKNTSLQLFSVMELKSSNPKIPPAILDVDLSYINVDGGTDWLLSGTIHDMSVVLLAEQFFDEDCSSGAMEVLGGLNLKALELIYTYSAGKASSFIITAILVLGGLELDLSYQYVAAVKAPPQGTPAKPPRETAASLQWKNNPPPSKEMKPLEPGPTKSWVFEAFLHVGSQVSTVGSIADSIVPGKSNDLPEFVRDIKIAAEGDPLNAPVKLIYQGSDKDGSVLAVWVNIGAFNLTFVQSRVPVTSSLQKPIVKQILRISADQIPMLDKVPLIKELPQPFEHLIYLWVDEGTNPVNPNPSPTVKRGLTRDIFEKNDYSINKVLEKVSIPKIEYKETKKSQEVNDLVLQAGHHFMIVANKNVVLDHVFELGKDKPAANPQPPGGRVINPGTIRAANFNSSDSITGIGIGTGDDTKAPVAAPATKGDVNTTAGPLSITAFSLQYKNNAIVVGVDATLVLGPLTFSVIGFTIEIDLKGAKLNELAALIKDHITVSIHGLAVGVDKPPLTLKGVFIHDIMVDTTGQESIESYRGGIAVGFKAWKVLAIGEYAIVTNLAMLGEYKSVFVYGKLNGPLVTLEFATISGVRVGFGFNSLVRLPPAEGLYQFPFISDSAAAGGDDPLKILNLMTQGDQPFVYKKEGGGWFCAGMTITCFDCITLTAVLMFEVETKSDQNGVIIALLADGVFQMPPLVDESIALFYIELLIKVELNFIEGFIAADAALAPASHVYVPWAHLTGSGSFYTWFAPSSHAGDWVVSIGGYHRAYTPPDHYPQRLKRLGLSFVVGNSIHVVGGAYVAVTPKCAMAGGSLHMSLEVGPVSASADIALDVFINFKPFYFIAEIRLSVSIECDIDLKLVSFHVSISLGADLVMWGPESFGGKARVHFWFFGFDIDFGAGLRDPPGIKLIEFDEIIRTPGPDSNPPPDDTTSKANPFQARHKYSIEDGLFPNKPKSKDGGFPDTGANSEWKVLAGSLQIRIDSDFSLSSASIVTKIEPKQKLAPQEGDSTAVVPPTDTEEDKNLPKITHESIFTVPKKELNLIYAFPMHNTIPITSNMEIIVYFLQGIEENKQVIPDFQCELVLKEAPRAIWDKYTSDSDPLSRISGGKRNKPRTLEAGENPTVELCQGVRLKAPEPILSKSPIVDFDATSAMQQIIPPGLPPIVPAGTKLLSFDASQHVYLAEEFEPDASPAAQWKDFGKLWNGATSPQTANAMETGIDKSEIRKIILGAPGVLGLLANTLGWNQRRPAEMKGGKVPISTNFDGTTYRMEWELVGDAPLILIEELDYYYPALPMVCGVA